MAIWQCSFLLVPTTEHAHNPEALLERAQSGAVWADTQPNEEIRRTANEVLGKSPTWSSEVDIWGDESSTCLITTREGSRIVEVLFRVDLRSIQKADLIRLLDGFQRARVLLVSENGQPCEPTLPAIRDALKASPAWEYVRDPQAFLSSLRESGGSTRS
jgi:hypothetical protein